MLEDGIGSEYLNDKKVLFTDVEDLRSKLDNEDINMMSNYINNHNINCSNTEINENNVILFDLTKSISFEKLN